MKKLLYACLATAFLAACNNDDNLPEDQQKDNFVVLTFEDADYAGSSATNYWSSLIDNPQYGGSLLNSADYYWYDEKNTYLQSSGLPGAYHYASGGQAVSNYVDTDMSHGDYTYQLAIPVKDATTGFGGHNGSKNFCVHYGSVKDATFDNTDLPFIFFGDGTPRVIDHMYVAPTTYLLNVEKNGNSMASPLGQNGWCKIVAYGIDADSNLTGKCEFYLYKDGKAVTEWTKWDLSSLGKVLQVSFNMEGSDTGSWGLNTPAYFAYDDVAVRVDD